MTVLEKGLDEHGLRYNKDYHIGNLTTFKIGGEAAYYSEPESVDQLKMVLKITSENGLEMSVIGKGSNILVNDKRVDKFVINLKRMNKFNIDGEEVYAEAGCSLPRLVVSTVEKELSGLETLCGIPASLGGAIFMNAGTKYSEMSKVLVEIYCMDNSGNVVALNPKEVNFGYRRSGLDGLIVVACKMKLKKDSKNEIMTRFRRFANEKKNTQPLSSYSAGCVYKNPQNDSAGRMIELAGLKGFRVGDAHISEKHANFIVNDKAATYGDVMRIIDNTRQVVNDRFGVLLDLEIKVW